MSADPLAALFNLLAPACTAPRDPMVEFRDLTASERDSVEYGEVVEAQGDYLALLGASIKYAAEAQADPEFYASLAQTYAADAEDARQVWIAKQSAYAAKHRGNSPRNNTGD